MSGVKKESLVWGAVILVVGTLFMLRNLGWEINVWHVLGKFWPLFLIFIGAKNIYQHFANKQ